MTHVVTDNCQHCRFTECVSVCPVGCFRLGDEMVYIDPDNCIDCGGCIPACPVGAIFDTYAMPAEHERWIEINAVMAKERPAISAPLPPLDGAQERRAALGFH